MKNLLMAGAAGRNLGKTEFLCRAIRIQSKYRPVIAIKVSTFDSTETMKTQTYRSFEGDFVVTREVPTDDNKDTHRMFRSGADKVYWLRTHRTALDRGLSALLQTMEEDGICLQTDCLIMESGGARNFIDPGLFFIIQEHDDTLKPSCSEVVHLADRLVKVTGDGWDILPEYLFFEDGTWGLKESAAAVVLSGGTSSRMGEDKSIMSINEEPLLSTITKQLQPNFESVIISGKKEKHSFFGCDVVEDLEPDKGPLMGLLSSLKYSRHEINFITTCDVPDIHLPFVRKMLREINDHEAIISVMNGKSQPLFAVYKKTVCSVIEQLLNEGKQAVHALLDRIDVMELELEGQWYHNLNTHDDVGRYRKSRS